MFDRYGQQFASILTGIELHVGCSLEEFGRMTELNDRRLYLYGEIATADTEANDLCFGASMSEKLIENILEFNRADAGLAPEDRDMIRLYINSPGGDLTEGFALISAIEASKTPICTINMGQWSSMAFLIGIAGHKRYSLPYSTFLMHDGLSGGFGSTNKLQDQMKFQERYENEVVKQHVLKHSQMKGEEYDARVRMEFYMLPEDALKYGFIDEIVTNIDDIL